METYLKLMQNPVEMKDLFFNYLKSRITHCRKSLFSAIERGCKMTSTTDGFIWEDGHFGFHAYCAMVKMSHYHDLYSWSQLRKEPEFELCLNQVVKEISRVNGPHSHFLAFFELYTCETWNNRK